MANIAKMKTEIKNLTNVDTFYEDARKIVGYYDNVHIEDRDIKCLQRIADARYAELTRKRYCCTITISEIEAAQINKHLHEEPSCADDCLGEDITITHTATFDNGITVDIKCCGVQYNEGEESNTAWTEAVLFKNGHEICCSEPSDEYLGEWILEYNNDEYVVLVEIEKTSEHPKNKYCVTVTRTGCVFIEAENEEEAMYIADHLTTETINWSDDWSPTSCEEDDTLKIGEYITEPEFK